MTGFQHISSDSEELLQHLAAQTYSALEMAGLPVHHSSGTSLLPGAQIEIDTGDDDAGGVYVLWRPSQQLSLAAADLVRRGQLSDPVVKRSGSIALSMRDAIHAILESAGFSVEVSPNDMQPLAVRVTSPS